LDKNPTQSTFLWGARQTGKSTLLRHLYPDAHYYDLLKTDVYLRLLSRPALLREELPPQAQHVIIDEFQKVPLLLNEVHGLIESRSLVFTLSGSSARKLRQTDTHLLGGRALKKILYGFSAHELGASFNLPTLLTKGYLPRHYFADNYREQLAAYVDDYFSEEIKNEGLVRNLPSFSGFLKTAAFSDGEMVNYSTIARDAGVSSHTIREYFAILVDTLMGQFVPAYQENAKRRTQKAPKFYFSNLGVVNHLSQRFSFAESSPAFGKAFENWVFHELSCYAEYSRKRFPICYWRLSTGVEVDFILGDMEIAIEAKASQLVNHNHLKNLVELNKDYPTIKKAYVVSLDATRRYLHPKLEVLPYLDFITLLWSGEII
jgi:predicted AAA+ superfamily ATPase